MNKKSKLTSVIKVVVCLSVILILFSIYLGPVTPSLRKARESAAMQEARSIGLSLSAYAKDHKGHYPEGKTSTEIFQQLIDGKYVEDPTIFFVTMAGKIRPESNQLKTENVCWDMTCYVDSSAPDQLPVVFLTGFKVTYQPGAAAAYLQTLERPFIAVCYYDNSAKAIEAAEDNSIPNFIPADFDPKGKTYRQLTP